MLYSGQTDIMDVSVCAEKTACGMQRLIYSPIHSQNQIISSPQKAAMSHKLSIDEYDALDQVSKLARTAKPSACISRNAKRLTGIKLLTYRKDGTLELTENGRQTLFIKQCIDGLRAIANDPEVTLSGTVASFLGKKGHVIPNEETGRLEISPRGRECLADIDANIINK